MTYDEYNDFLLIAATLDPPETMMKLLMAGRQKAWHEQPYDPDRKPN